MELSGSWIFTDRAETRNKKTVYDNWWVMELEFADGSHGYETPFELHIYDRDLPEENKIYLRELESIRFLQRSLAEIEKRIQKRYPHLDNRDS